jgi:hypothetical protein
MSVKQEESRRFPRIKFSNPLRFQVRGSPDSSTSLSENISLNGIGFMHNNFIAPLTPLMLEIKLLSRVLRPIGRVVWSSPSAHSNRYRLGVEFLEMDIQEKKVLSDFINMRVNQYG